VAKVRRKRNLRAVMTIITRMDAVILQLTSLNPTERGGT